MYVTLNYYVNWSCELELGNRAVEQSNYKCETELLCGLEQGNYECEAELICELEQGNHVGELNYYVNRVG